ncbi:hypothetical protein AURDEDRAFT_43904, partial [Auricularia subglabra TFB-10046 SS5]
FDSLTATNYATWLYCMEMRLVKMDLWDVVASTAAPPANKLQTVHNAHGFGTCMSLCRWLHRMKWDDFVSLNMHTWITAVQEVVQHIRDLDGEVSDEDIIVVLTESLPDSYQPLIVTFDSLPDDNLTVDYVIGRLIKEESRQDRDTPV